MGSIPVRVTKEVPAHPRRNFFDGYPYGNRKTGPEGAVNMPVAYSPGRGRFPPERTSREEASSDDGGERSLPGITKEVPAHPRRNFFDGYPQGNRRAVPGALGTSQKTSNIRPASLPGKHPPVQAFPPAPGDSFVPESEKCRFSCRENTKTAAQAAVFATRKRRGKNEKDHLESFVCIIAERY